MSADINELQEKFQVIQDHLKEAAQATAELFGGDDVPPPAAKARYEAITKVEEAYMWIANGVQALLQLDQKVQEAAEALTPEVLDNGKPALKVIK